MAQIYQALLDANGCTGRGVRFKHLTPSERDTMSRKAATLAGKEATIYDLRMLEFREGVKAMLHSVTRETSLTFEQAQAGAWQKLDAHSLEMPGELNYDTLFNAKDDAVLTALYRRAHEVSVAEIEAIAGKALPVSVD